LGQRGTSLENTKRGMCCEPRLAEAEESGNGLIQQTSSRRTPGTEQPTRREDLVAHGLDESGVIDSLLNPPLRPPEKEKKMKKKEAIIDRRTQVLRPTSDALRPVFCVLGPCPVSEDLRGAEGRGCRHAIPGYTDGNLTYTRVRPSTSTPKGEPSSQGGHLEHDPGQHWRASCNCACSRLAPRALSTARPAET